MLRSNSLRSTEHKLFSLYTNTKSYKDNTVFHGLPGCSGNQTTHTQLISTEKDYELLERCYYIINLKA